MKLAFFHNYVLLNVIKRYVDHSQPILSPKDLQGWFTDEAQLGFLLKR